MYAACHTSIDNHSKSLVNSICNPNATFSNVHTEFGIKNEQSARQVYLKAQLKDHPHMQIKNCGLLTSPSFPFLGASPDGIIICDCGKCDGGGCLEIKCLSKFRKCSIKEVMSYDKTFFLYDNEEGQLLLKEDHPHYYQCQSQIFLSNSSFCDFVVWTEVDSVIIRIQSNEPFWNLRCLEASTFGIRQSCQNLLEIGRILKNNVVHSVIFLCHQQK